MVGDDDKIEHTGSSIQSRIREARYTKSRILRRRDSRICSSIGYFRRSDTWKTNVKY